jgi:Flp pilus assembly protein TadG
MIKTLHPGPDDAGTIPGRRQTRQGQALIEFAVVGMLLATMTFGVLEFGRAYYASISVTNAARDAARMAMDPSNSNADIISAAEAAADPLTLTDVSISRSTTVGETATVTVTFEFNSFVPLIENTWGGGPLAITETATSRVGWDE